MGAPAISTRTRTRPAPKRRPVAAPKSKPKAATTHRAAARTAPKARVRHTSAAGLAIIPAGAVGAVGRTAGAVGGLADCGLVLRLTRGRAWIVVLALLLGGIVAINVWGLGLSASSSATAAKIEGLQRDNSVLAGRIASRTSNGTIEAAAAKFGLAVPAPDGVHYLDVSPNDAERAAERLANDKISPTPPDPPVVPVVPEAVDPVAATVEDPAVAVVDPVVEPVTTPVEPTSGTVDPVTGAVIP